MKKLISILLALAALLTLAACAPQEEAVQATLDPSSPEAMYGHIDQSQPIGGVYKLWNKDGLQQLAAHPDASFQLLCSIDAQGMVMAPIAEFTGTIDGMNFTISNLTIQGEGADFGFVGVNKGKINSLYLDMVTFQPGKATNIGSFAGRNEGTILRCMITNSAMTVENTAEGAFCGGLVGVNTGEIKNTSAAVDVSYTAAQAATVGGIAGKDVGGKLEFVDMSGFLTISGTNKTTGVLVGSAKDTTLDTCAFIGADNSLGGKVFTNYYGTEENVTGTTLLLRDNTRAPERPHVQEKREKAVQVMYDMCTIEWHPENIIHTCNCSLNMCNGVYNDTYTYYGLPYNHKNGSLARMQYCLNEDGTVKDFIYEMAEEGTFDTFDLYMGSDCSSHLQQAWLSVSNSVDYRRTRYQTPAVRELRNTGCYAVGDWEWDIGLDPTADAATITKNYTVHNGEEVMYESYAQLRLADAVVFYYETGHTRMVAQEPVVVRDENGKISGEYSYVLMHEQGVTVLDEVNMTYSTCPTFKKYTFANLFNGYYLPITNEEFMTGEFDEPTCVLEGGIGENNRLALTTGVVKANYSLDYVTMTITDKDGNVVFDHWMFPSVTKRLDNNSNDYHIRRVFKEYDLAGFAIPLMEVAFQKGDTYHAVVTGNLATGDSYTLLDFDFTN